MKNPYVNPSRNKITVIGINIKNNLFSLLVSAGFRNSNILYIKNGQVIIKAENKPILIDRSAN